MSEQPIPASLRDLTVPIASLKHYSKNPRQGDVGAIMESLRVNGQYRPVVVNRRTDEVLAGNHTLKAARELGWSEIAATFVDVDDEAAARIALVDNRANDLAAYDDHALLELITSLPSLEGTGFDGDDLDSLIQDLSSGQSDESSDAQEAVPDDPVTKLGDLWQLGEHLLRCADSLDFEVLEALYGDSQVGCVLTDPPYGMALETDFKQMHKNGKPGTYEPVIGDDKPFDPQPQMDFFADVAEQWWWGADYYRDKLPAGGSWLVWDKRFHETMNLEKALGNHFELAWSKQSHLRIVLRYLWSGHHGMQGEDTRSRVHPTQKPTGLISDILNRWAPRDCLVADPFLGSGSTLIACEQTGRRCYGVELDPGYCDVIIDRWERHTGREAEKLNG